MTRVVAVDIGGTHARFALAEVSGGRVVSLDEPVTLKTAEHASFQTAWESFAAQQSAPLPHAAAIAIACPISGEVLQLTNNPWIIRPALIPEKLHVERHVLVNDFEAIGHAVAQVGSDYFRHVCGPDEALPERGITSIVGPGTGLGIGQLFRHDGTYHVIACEGGHVDFAPLDSIEDAILAALRKRYRRVSVERVASGPGLAAITEVLAQIEGRDLPKRDDKELWTAALEGTDSIAAAALDRFCMILGSVAGDCALTNGPTAVVIAGGLGLRIADHLPRSGFAQRFVAKGRFEGLMSRIPVKLITHPQPGLFGAAAAFARTHT
jgi:glucokinase